MDFLTQNTIIEIIVLATVNYMFIRHLQRTRGGGLIAGFIVIALIIVVALGFILDRFDLRHLNFIANSALPGLVFAILVIFQPELRLAIQRIGSFKLVRNVERLFTGRKQRDVTPLVMAIVAACRRLSKSKTGALIGIQRREGIEGFAGNSVQVNADISAALIENIFYKGSPLHDGALLLISGRLMFAGCHLPLSDNPHVSQRLGTRHRAALALAEESDAIVVVVSEETGRIAVARDGTLERNVSWADLEEAIASGLREQFDSADAPDEMSDDDSVSEKRETKTRETTTTKTARETKTDGSVVL